MSNPINLNSKLGAMAAHAARTMPSDDEISRRAATKYLESKKDPNQFENWFHAVKDNDIRHPKTKVTPFPLEASIAISKEDEHTFLSNPELTIVEKSIKDAFTEFGRDELFLKNSLYSGKHSWARTCHIKHDSNIRHHLGQITYEWLMNSPVYATHMVVRELIPTAPVFYAFGGTPIVQEFRLFAKDGKTYAYQAYWPQDSILDPNCDDWASKLKSISKATQTQLHEMIAGANKVTKTLGGDWSIDFLIDKDGKPWLIDMALSSQSYISPERVPLN